MVTQTFPTITSEIVDLGETMRQAQLHYEKLINDRDQQPTQHQVRRAAQAKKAAAEKYDLWILSYRAEMKKYMQMFEAKKTDELPGLFTTEG